MILRAVKRTEETLQRSDVAFVRCNVCDTQYDIFLDSGLVLQIGDETKPDLTRYLRLLDLAISKDHAQGHRYQKYICDGRSAFPL